MTFVGNLSTMIGAYIKITGRVQGVGFRYFTMKQANLFGLNGYVKNRSDGSVEVEVEGEKEIIDKFKSVLEQGPGFSSVEKVDMSQHPYTAKYNKFTVEY
jgi:acylphosphatase